jgi:Dpy-30 motif
VCPSPYVPCLASSGDAQGTSNAWLLGHRLGPFPSKFGILQAITVTVTMMSPLAFSGSRICRASRIATCHPSQHGLESRVSATKPTGVQRRTCPTADADCDATSSSTALTCQSVCLSEGSDAAQGVVALLEAGLDITRSNVDAACSDQQPPQSFVARALLKYTVTVTDAMSDDADYLKDSVGQVLAKAVADTLAASPTDPVQYMGEWLHRYVDNVRVKDDLEALRAKQAAEKQAAQEELIAAQTSRQAVLDAKHAAIEEVNHAGTLSMLRIRVVSPPALLLLGNLFS